MAYGVFGSQGPGSVMGNIQGPQQGSGQQSPWQPRAPQQYPEQSWPTPQTQQQAQGQQSLEQRALAGGSNAQQTSNWLAALRLGNAGGNNAFMSGAPAQRQAPGPIVGAPMGSNGDNGYASYAGGFGAQGGAASLYNMPQQQNQQVPMYRGMQSAGAVSGGSSGTVNISDPTAIMHGIQLRHEDFMDKMGGGQGLYDATQKFGPAYAAYLQQQAQQNQAAPPPSWNTSDFFNRLRMSDENAKTNIEPGEEEVAGMLGELGVHSYEYKNPKHGEGRYVSPMAQELAKTELGRSAVIPTREGLAVDYGRLGGITLSAAAMHERRLDEQEAQIAELKRLLRGGKKRG